MGTGTHRLIILRRGVLLLAAVLLAWSVAVLVTGGFVVETQWRTLSSRAAIRPFIAAALLLILYASRWRRHLRRDLGPAAHLPITTGLALAATCTALLVGLGWGPRLAGGPDAAGYVSQAAMFARGELTVPAAGWVSDTTWPNAAVASAPIGYHPRAHSRRLAPTYSPGLPLLMAVFQVVAGPRAVFLVVPLLAAVCVWATYRLGVTLGGQWTGAIAAILLVSSPTFLVMTVQAMSDVPVTTFWTVSLLAALRGHALRPSLAGGMAILIRPNLVPLGAIPLVLLVTRSDARIRRAALFTTALVPAAGIVAGLNWFYRGDPLRSGYGSFGYLYSMSRVLPNLERYARWFRESQTLLPLVGFFAPVLARASSHERIRLLLVCLVFPASLVVLYLPYLVFQPHEWGYLRFLLPGYPALMVGVGICCTVLIERVRWRTTAVVGTAFVVGALAVHGWQFASHQGVFAAQQADERYARAVAHVRTLEPDAVVVSLAHSGTLWFYTGRDVLRFDAIENVEIDTALAELQARGRAVYLVGDPFEIVMFRQRFAGTAAERHVAAARATDLQGALVYRVTAATARSSEKK
jgi:hypothetical protein